MAIFQSAYKNLSEKEGGYVRDPLDRGGETYAGISRRFHPYWKGWRIINRVKEEYGTANINARLKGHCVLQKMVREFYKVVFWNANQLSLIKDHVLAESLLIAGVHIGNEDAAMKLQRALNVTNANEKYYPDLMVDGVIGPNTRKAIHTHPYLTILINLFSSFMACEYASIQEDNPRQERYIGWYNRLKWI